MAAVPVIISSSLLTIVVAMGAGLLPTLWAWGVAGRAAAPHPSPTVDLVSSAAA